MTVSTPRPLFVLCCSFDTDTWRLLDFASDPLQASVCPVRVTHADRPESFSLTSCGSLWLLVATSGLPAPTGVTCFTQEVVGSRERTGMARWGRTRTDSWWPELPAGDKTSVDRRGCCDLRTCGPGSPGLRPSAVGTVLRWPVSLQVCGLSVVSGSPAQVLPMPGGVLILQGAARLLLWPWTQGGPGVQKLPAEGWPWACLDQGHVASLGKLVGRSQPGQDKRRKLLGLGAVTRMGQAALRPLGVGQRRAGQSWWCWAGGEMVREPVPSLGWGQRLSISPVPVAAAPLSQGGRSNQGLGGAFTGLLHRKPLGKAPCAPWGFGCPARRDAHSSSLSTRGVLQRAPEPAGPLAQPHCSPQSHLFLGLTAQLEKPPLPAGKPPAGRSGLCPALPAGGGSWESRHSSSHRPLGQQGQAPTHPGLCPAQVTTPGPWAHSCAGAGCGRPGPAHRWLLSLCRPPPGRPCPAGPGTPGPTASRGKGCAPRYRRGPGPESARIGRPSQSCRWACFQAEQRAPAPRPAPPPRPGPPSEPPRHGPAPALAPCTDATAEPAGRNLPGAGRGRLAPLPAGSPRSGALAQSPGPARAPDPPPAHPPGAAGSPRAALSRAPRRRKSAGSGAAAPPAPGRGPHSARWAAGGRARARGRRGPGEKPAREPQASPAGRRMPRVGSGVCAAPAARKRKPPNRRRPGNFAAGGAGPELRGPLPGLVSRPAGGQRRPARCFPGYK